MRNSIPKAVSKEVRTDCIQDSLLASCPTTDFANMEWICGSRQPFRPFSPEQTDPFFFLLRCFFNKKRKKLYIETVLQHVTNLTLLNSCNSINAYHKNFILIETILFLSQKLISKCKKHLIQLHLNTCWR